jgi:MFS transporter, ACS family, glucarate transporter
LSGYLLPPLSRRLNSMRRARRIVATTGFIGAACFMAACAQSEGPWWAMAAMGMASFCNDITMPCGWGACMDVGGKYAGTLSGSMNMMGNMAGFVAPLVGGFILSHTNNNYPLFLNTMAVAYLLGAFCWPFIDPVTSLEETGKEA